jgi:hypothetical protein
MRPVLDKLTPELAAEVRRSLILTGLIALAASAAFSILFGLAVDPEPSNVTGGVAVVMFLLFTGMLVPILGIVVALAYLFECWPILIRRSFLHEHYGVPIEKLRMDARRQEMRSAGYWMAAGRGAVVGWGFVSAAIMIWWAFTGKWSFSGPSLVLVVLAAQFSAQAWAVRAIVGRHLAEQAETPAQPAT